MIGEAAALGEAVGMHEDEDAELLRLGEERTEARVREFRAGDVGADLDAAEIELLHHALELGDGKLRRLQRHRAQADEAVGMAGDDLGDVVVDDARGLRARARAAAQ